MTMKFLLILAATYLFFRLFFKYVFPYLLVWFVKKEVKKQRPKEAPREKEGDIHIHKKNPKDSSKDEGGKYIDFEEVDDE